MVSRVASFPIAETFVSIQGEGKYAGTKMFFIRLAGCNVGRYEANKQDFHILPDVSDLSLVEEKKHSICTSATGQVFMCDTNYHKTTELTWIDLGDAIIESGCKHVCITGGEPLLHNLHGFATRIDSYLATAVNSPITLHIETSGTLPLEEIADWCACITCSPKKGFLPENLQYVHQLKFVVSSVEELRGVSSLLKEWRLVLDGLRHIPVYISPVAPVSLVGELSDYLLAAQKLYTSPDWDPAWRLNLQQHKILGVR